MATMGGDPPVEASWLLAALDQSSDLIVVIDAEATVKWVSAGVRRLGGYDPASLVGRSMVEFVHPDDLERAAEVMDLAGEATFDYDTPMTPALYRLRHSDGSWVTLEINATRSSTGETDLLLVIRRAGDLVLHDQLLELVTGGGSVEAQFDLVLELGHWRYPSDGYVVISREDDGTQLIRSRGVTDGRLCATEPVDGPTPWALAMASREPVIARDLDDAAVLAPELAALAEAEGFAAVLALPVADPANDVGACLVVWSTPDGPSVSGQRYPMNNMERALTLVLQWRAHRRELERAANVDSLTGLASRQRFFAVAPRLLDNGAQAVLYVDLDRFKDVNDHYGHSAGDYVLRTTASRIAGVLGPEALVGRLGGDEFAILCPPGTTSADAQEAAAAIVEAAREPIELDAGTVKIGASVGVAMREREESLDAALERADRALLAIKGAGRDGWRIEA
jgi:diguanylate cyclase (GGDEF)-like protein/PAS domain S-box-containing protein